MHSNGKIQKRTDDAGKHRDRVTKELAFTRSTDNVPIEQERKHHLWAHMQKGETEEALLIACFLSRLGNKVTRKEGKMETKMEFQQEKVLGRRRMGKMDEGQWEIQACTYEMRKSQG